MEVNRKFNFRPEWKSCWDLSNVISGGNWLFRWDSVFFRWDFVPLCKLWVVVLIVKGQLVVVVPSGMVPEFELSISRSWNLIYFSIIERSERMVQKVKGQKWSKVRENSVCHTSYLRNHTSYDCHLWYSCVNWKCKIFSKFWFLGC